MKDNIDNIDELIAKFLAGETSPEENTLLENWKNSSPENAAYYEESVNLFSHIDSFHTTQTVNTDAAWNKLDSRILSGNETKVISINRKPILLRAAAAIALIAVLSILVKLAFTGKAVEPVILAATNTTINKTLPDGSTVFVNKNTELSYILNSNNEREVRLKGEAFFEVVHDEKQPFVISVDDILIKDIGTAFNVKAIPGSDIVEVLVESGEVQFYSKNNPGLKLVKGEKAAYSRSTKQFAKMVPDINENTTSYRTKIFHYKDTPLRDVIAQINQVYGTNIVITDDKVGNCKVSVGFNNEKPDTIINIISETLNLEVERNGKTVTLKGQPCP